MKQSKFQKFNINNLFVNSLLNDWTTQLSRFSKPFQNEMIGRLCNDIHYSKAQLKNWSYLGSYPNDKELGRRILQTVSTVKSKNLRDLIVKKLTTGQSAAIFAQPVVTTAPVPQTLKERILSFISRG